MAVGRMVSVGCARLCSILALIIFCVGSVDAQLTLTGGGLTLVEEGPAADAAGDPAPVNLATGATPFALDELDFGTHYIVNLNNGTYGNSSSWIGNGALGTVGPFVGISLAFPVIYVSTLYSKGVAVWIIIGILSLEFAAGGLKNTLATLKKSSSYIPQMTKTLFLNGAGLAGLLLILFSVPEQTQILNALLIIVFAASLIFCLRFFYIHRDALLTNKQMPA